MGFAVTGRWILRWSPVCIFNEAKIMHAGLLFCFVFFFCRAPVLILKEKKKWQKDTKTNKIEREKERGRQCSPGATSYYLLNVMQHSKHWTRIPLGKPWCYSMYRNMLSSCINLPVNLKKCLSSKNWPRNVKRLSHNVLRWEEIMQGTNLLAEVINYKLFYWDSQRTG